MNDVIKKFEIYCKAYINKNEIAILLDRKSGKTVEKYINALNSRKDISTIHLLIPNEWGEYKTADIIREFRLQENFQVIKTFYDIYTKNIANTIMA